MELYVAKIYLPNPWSQIFPKFSFKRFVVLGLWYFSVFYVVWGKDQSFFVFHTRISNYSSTSFWKITHFPLNCLGTFVKNQWSINVRIHFCTFLFHLSILMPVHTRLNSGIGSSPTWFIFFTAALAILDPLYFHMNWS